MTIEELEAKGFVFEVDFYRYRVTVPKPTFFNMINKPRITVSDVRTHLPDSKERMLERARMDALLYFVRTRLSQ